MQDTSQSTFRDEGFGLIEIVVTMFMLALLAMAFLPVLIQGIRTTAATATLASATRLANQSVELARSAAFTNCPALESFAAVTVPGDDGRGTDLVVSRALPDGCDASDGLPERLVVEVAPADDSADVLVSVTTHVLLGD